MGQVGTGALQCTAKAFRIDRLQHVVDRLRIERSHGVLIECGHEHDRWHAVAPDGFNDGEPIEFGHLHIEEDEVGRKRADRRDRSFTVTALFDDFDVRLLPQQPQYPAAGDRFIVNDQYADGHGTVRQGSSISAMTPPSSEFRTSKRCLSAYSKRNRALVFARPTRSVVAGGRPSAVIDNAQQQGVALPVRFDFHAPRSGARG